MATRGQDRRVGRGRRPLHSFAGQVPAGRALSPVSGLAGSRPAGKSPGISQFPLVSPQEISGVIAEASSEVWDLQRIHDFVATSVGEVLSSRSVPRRYIKTPGLEIAVPAIEAMRYCSFRKELVCLIAASMDERFSHRAHPAFVNILRQLTQDELRLLTLMPPSGEVVPLAHIHAQDSEGRTLSIRRNLLPEGLSGHCEVREAVPTYIDNLLRLQLVAVPGEARIATDEPYKDILKEPAHQRALQQAAQVGKPRVVKSALMLTNLGEHFSSVCLS